MLRQLLHMLPHLKLERDYKGAGLRSVGVPGLSSLTAEGPERHPQELC
jgi:hypothetical protein